MTSCQAPVNINLPIIYINIILLFRNPLKLSLIQDPIDFRITITKTLEVVNIIYRSKNKKANIFKVITAPN